MSQRLPHGTYEWSTSPRFAASGRLADQIETSIQASFRCDSPVIQEQPAASTGLNAVSSSRPAFRAARGRSHNQRAAERLLAINGAGAGGGPAATARTPCSRFSPRFTARAFVMLVRTPSSSS